MSQFDKLLAELKSQSDEQATLAKSLPAEDGKDDEAIQAAAAEADADNNPEDNADEDVDAPAAKDKDKGEIVAKSMSAVVDGEEIEVVDATEILKSLTGRLDATEQVLAKALESTLGTIKSQGDMIKSLNARVAKLAGEGKGRKTVLTVVEKPAVGDTMAKSESAQEGMTTQQFMAKAHAAFSAGKLSGQELTTADVAIRSGAQIPAGIIAKALS